MGDFSTLKKNFRWCRAPSNDRPDLVNLAVREFLDQPNSKTPAQ
jgi:hypothetical protein